MLMRKAIKGSLISLAVLGMVGGSMNNTIANAKHRHVHYTRRIKRTRHSHRRSRLYRHHGKIRYSYRRNRHTRRHYAKKYRHISNHKHVTVRRHHAKRSRADATHKYIVGTNIDGGQLLGNDPRDAASATPGGSDDGTLVKVGKKLILDGHTFYKISSKNDIDANGWIYAGDLSNRPNGKAHPFNWNKNEPKIEKWENQQNNNSNIPDNSNQSNSNSNEVTPSIPTTPQKHIHHTNINQDLADMKSQTANDINNDRQENGVSPLAETNELDNIAQMRANTPSQTSEHTDPSTGNYYNEEAAYKLGYVSDPSGDDYAENLDGAWESPNSQDGISYNPHNGKEVADECNDVMMNHDQPSDNGHRQNILDSDYSQMGVGTSYNPSNKSFHVVEEFY